MLTKPMVFIFISVLLGCGSTVHANSQEKVASNTQKQTIYFGDDIVTMHAANPNTLKRLLNAMAK